MGQEQKLALLRFSDVRAGGERLVSARDWGQARAKSDARAFTSQCALGTAIAVAGGDKLTGETGYKRMFGGLGWAQSDMRVVAIVEVVGGALMIPRRTRRLGGAIVAAASAAVLNSELRDGDTKLAGARALVFFAGLSAMLAPGG